MADEDEELFDDPFADEPDPEVEAAAKAKADAESKARGVIEKERAKHDEEAGQLLGALKSAWAGAAASEYPLADVDSIALTGVDEEAKGKFLAEMKAKHETEEARLRAAGYSRVDAEGNPIPVVVPQNETPEAAADQSAAAAWGAPVGGSDASPAAGDRAQLEKEVIDAARQGPRQVLDVLFNRTSIKDKILQRR